MNKYQEALDFIKEELLQANLLDEEEWNIINSLAQFKKLQELVDKEKPMKPVKGTLCGKCNSFLVINGIKFHRCLRLGCERLVDWSDEE